MTTKTLSQAMGPMRRNNFDFLRFAAASLVIISHSFLVLGAREPAVGSAILGKLGVYVFFIISGFLIAQSWDLHPRVLPFIAKRILRIVPGLAAVTLFVLLVVGPVFTQVPLGQYFSDPLAHAYLGNILVFFQSTSLPGVWHSNPFPDNTNAPLWTLPVEFFAYLCVALVGSLSLASGRIRLRLPFWPAAAGVVGVTYLLLTILPYKGLNFLGSTAVLVVVNLAFFIMGALLYLRRHTVIFSDKLALAALIVFAASPFLPEQFYLRLLALPYLVIYLAFMPAKRLPDFARHGDLSYGMYIYAWPVEQSVYAMTSGHISPLQMLLVTSPVVLLLAWLSWNLVEKPALKLKKPLGPSRPLPDSSRPANLSGSARTHS